MNSMLTPYPYQNINVNNGADSANHATALKSPHEAGGRGGESTRAGGGADFIFSASERVVMALDCSPGRWCVCGMFCAVVSV